MNGAFSFSGAIATRTREKSGAKSHGPDGANNAAGLPREIDFPEIRLRYPGVAECNATPRGVRVFRDRHCAGSGTMILTAHSRYYFGHPSLEAGGVCPIAPPNDQHTYAQCCRGAELGLEPNARESRSSIAGCGVHAASDRA